MGFILVEKDAPLLQKVAAVAHDLDSSVRVVAV